MILPHKLVVLVADGGRMLVLRNEGDTRAPQLRVLEHRDCPAPANRDIFADAPGRSFASHSPDRSAYDQGDPHAALERGFLAAAAAALADHVDAATPGIVVAADPISLGHLRDHYPPGIADRLLAELDKDLAGMPVEAITQYLLEAPWPARD